MDGEQQITREDAFRFGARIEEVEKALKTNSVDCNTPISRKGIDRLIVSETYKLSFDSGFLKRFEFNVGFAFHHQLTPFPDPWKNLSPVGNLIPKSRMTKGEFQSYLAAWERRARPFAAAAHVVDDLTADGYFIDREATEFTDCIGIHFGPIRRTSKRGIWCDGWIVFFCTEVMQNTEVMKKSGVSPGEVMSITAFCDAFNTRAR